LAVAANFRHPFLKALVSLLETLVVVELIHHYLQLPLKK
jgi:hypothetical protein